MSFPELDREFKEIIESGDFVEGDPVLVLIEQVFKLRKEVAEIRNGGDGKQRESIVNSDQLIEQITTKLNNTIIETDPIVIDEYINYDRLSNMVAEKVSKLVLGGIHLATSGVASSASATQREDRSEQGNREESCQKPKSGFDIIKRVVGHENEER